MKKIIKFVLFPLLLVGGLAVSICYMVIPQETKSAIDIVVGYMNTPIGIVGGTTITVGLVAGIVVKLIYDRYKNNIHSELELYKGKVEELKQQAKDYEELAQKHYEELTTILNDIVEKETKDFDYITENFINACKLNPNAKVKALGKEVEKGLKEYGEERKETIDSKANEE